MAKAPTIYLGRAAQGIGSDVEAPILAGGPTPLDFTPFRIGSEDAKDTEERVRAIVERLNVLAREQVTAKSEIEERMLRDVRAYHGFYDPTTELELKNERQSRSFVKATRAKTVALEARLFDMIFPTDDRNWGIKATPVPKLAKEAGDAVAQAKKAAEDANAAEEAGDPAAAQQAIAKGNDQAERAQLAQQVIDKANESADLMQTEMDDQLVESQYPIQSRDMIHDACVLGTGILKGPLVNESQRGKWMPQIPIDPETGREYRPKVVTGLDGWPVE